MSSSRSARLVFAALAVATLAVGISTAPASAVPVSSDPIRITAQELDFGADPWTLGSPNQGVLVWDVAGGNTTPILRGKIYINNAAGTCARMRVESYDINHVFINARDGGTVCAPDGALHRWSVNLAPAGHPDTTHAHVMLQVQTGATWSNVGTGSAWL